MKKHNKLKKSNKKFKYSDEFICFEKILFKLNEKEKSIKNWQILLKKQNIKKEFFKLIRKDISNLKLISLLLATRWEKFRLNIDFNLNKKQNISDYILNKIYLELEKTQIFEIFKTKKIINIKDYLLGILAGMDTHARKNRNGKRFEDKIQNLLEKKQFKFNKQVNFNDLNISYKFKKDLNEEIKKRKIDFVLLIKNKTFLIEVNTFNVSGSKIYKTSTDFKYFQDIVHKHLIDFEFIWVSGGKFWDKETLIKKRNKEKIKFFFNLKEFEEWLNKLTM